MRLGGGLHRGGGRLRHLPGRRHQVRQGGGRLQEAEPGSRLQGDAGHPGGVAERARRGNGGQRELHRHRQRGFQELLPQRKEVSVEMEI